MNIALLGDSTLDNAAYTEGGPDVVAHLTGMLVGKDRATLLATDGATLAAVPHQIGELRDLLRSPGDHQPPTHVVLSVGGNDLIGEVELLGEPADSVGGALLTLGERAEDFGRRYRELLDEVLDVGLPVVVCTVYGGWFEDARQARMIETTLRVFDQEIVEAGLDRGLPVIDLRRVCSEPEDYFDPIEPSERGGRKIAAAVVGAVWAPGYDLNGPAVTVQGTGGMGGAA